MVEHGREWPGVRSTPQACMGVPKTVTRPEFFFRDDGDMPESAELCFGIPPSHAHLEPRDFVELLADAVAAAEAEARQRVRAAGRHFLGPAGVRRQRWSDRAKTPEPHGAKKVIRPMVIASDPATRRAILARIADFRRAYRKAREALAQGGRQVRLPVGTYQLRLQLGVRCHSP